MDCRESTRERFPALGEHTARAVARVERTELRRILVNVYWPTYIGERPAPFAGADAPPLSRLTPRRATTRVSEGVRCAHAGDCRCCACEQIPDFVRCANTS